MRTAHRLLMLLFCAWCLALSFGLLLSPSFAACIAAGEIARSLFLIFCSLLAAGLSVCCFSLRNYY